MALAAHFRATLDAGLQAELIPLCKNRLLYLGATDEKGSDPVLGLQLINVKGENTNTTIPRIFNP